MYCLYIHIIISILIRYSQVYRLPDLGVQKNTVFRNWEIMLVINLEERFQLTTGRSTGTGMIASKRRHQLVAHKALCLRKTGNYRSQNKSIVLCQMIQSSIPHQLIYSDHFTHLSRCFCIMDLHRLVQYYIRK